MRIPLESLRVGQKRCVLFDSRQVLVCRTAGGVFAIENRCPHAEFPLADGTLAGDTIRCPTHGAKFDLRTGESLTKRFLVPVRTYGVLVEDGFVTLSLPEARD